ncbi:MAG: HAMP domain-containing protein [Chloroflexi bacterium]|nr:HAMP domain-containing protein [Chloroflexota bacterium]
MGVPRGLVPRLVSLTALVVLVATGLIGAVLIDNSRSTLRQEILDRQLQVADLAAEFAARYVEAAQVYTHAVAADNNIVQAILDDAPERAGPVLAALLANNPRLDGLGIIDVAGTSRVGGLVGMAAIGSSVADRDWFQQAMATRQPYLGAPVISRASGRAVVPYGVPVLDSQGRVRAVIGGSISLAALSDAITSLGGGATARASLTDTRQGGIILAHPDPERILQPISEQNEATLRVVAGERGTLETGRGSGELDLAAFAPVPGLPWGVLLQQPSAVAFAPVEAMIRRALLLIGAVTLVAVAGGALVALQITRPLVRLRDVAHQIASGDSSVRADIAARDEVGDVGRAFDYMVGVLANRTAQLESAIKELEAFSYTVSHDLRAPLRAMDGFSRILVEEHAPQLTPEAQRYLRLVRDNAQQMGRLIDDLLAFSCLSRQPLAKHRVQPANLARQALAELRSEQEGRQVELSIGDLPPCLGDPALLRQVFANLLANALKFTRPCEVAVIEVGSREEDGQHVYFVKDNGVGFDMRYADKLFGVFQRLHRARDYEGTGVGLAIVQRIVHRHGGRVWAEAEVNQGATFYFTLEGGL